jgi:replicative superfamily II helicase
LELNEFTLGSPEYNKILNEIETLKDEGTSALSFFKTNLETVNIENKIINEFNGKISEIFKNKFTGDDFNILEYINNFND